MTTSPRDLLAAAKRTLRITRDVKSRAEQAVSRARQVAAETQARVDAAAIDANWLRAQGDQLAAAIVAGSRNPAVEMRGAPERIDPTTNPEVLAARAAIAKLEADAAQARAQLATAEQNVEAAVDAVLEAEALQIVSTLDHAFAEVQRLAQRLLEYQPDARVEHTPVLRCQPEITRVLDKVPQRRGFDTPVHELRHGHPVTSRLAAMRRALTASDADAQDAAA